MWPLPLWVLCGGDYSLGKLYTLDRHTVHGSVLVRAFFNAVYGRWLLSRPQSTYFY